MAPLVLTKAGENVTPHEINVSAVRVILLASPSELRSSPITMIKESVVRAGDGFLTLPIVIEADAMGVLLRMALLIVILLPVIEHVKLVTGTSSISKDVH